MYETEQNNIKRALDDVELTLAIHNPVVSGQIPVWYQNLVLEI